MPDTAPVDPDRALARARLRAKRIALGLIAAVAVVVIGSSTWEITASVFGLGIRPVTDRACAEGVRGLVRALDRATPAAGSPGFAAALEPEWKDTAPLADACARSPEGLDAWAALLRLRSGEEVLTGIPGDDFAALRHDVLAHLPADLR